MVFVLVSQIKTNFVNLVYFVTNILVTNISVTSFDILLCFLTNVFVTNCDNLVYFFTTVFVIYITFNFNKILGGSYH